MQGDLSKQQADISIIARLEITTPPTHLHSVFVRAIDENRLLRGP